MEVTKVASRNFTINDFKVLLLRVFNAHSEHDGSKLQNLEAEIIDTYRSTTMNERQYKVLINTCGILLGDWRKNWK